MLFYFLLPAILAFAITLALVTAIRLVLISRAKINLSGACLLMTMVLALFGYQMQLVNNDVLAMSVFQFIQAVGLNSMYPAWIIFLLYFTGQDEWVTPRLLAGLGLVSVLPILTMAIPSLRDWIFIPEGLVQAGPYLLLKQRMGIMVWLSTAAAQILGVAGVLLLANKYKQVRPGYRFRYYLLILLPFFAFISIWIELSGRNPIAPISLFNLAIIPVSLIIGMAIYSLRVGEELHSFREQVVDSMHSAVLILDAGSCLAYANQAAKQLFALPDLLPARRTISAAFPQLNALVNEAALQAGDSRAMVAYDEFFFRVDRSQIRDWKDELVGQVFLLHNVTDRDLMASTILERNQAMAHTNNLLSGLAEVSLHIQKNVDISSIYAVLDRAFQKMGLSCCIALLDPGSGELHVHYMNGPESTIPKVEKLLGIRVNGFRLARDKFPQLYEYFDSNRQDGIIQLLAERLPLAAFSGLMAQALRMLGIEPGSSMAILNLEVSGSKLGLISIWGHGLRQDDLDSLRIFASQVAWAIGQANRYKDEVQRSTALGRTNAMIMALSNVAAHLGTTSNLAEVFEILGRELKKVKINCMVGTLDAGKQYLKIEYLSVDEEIFAWGERFGVRWPEDIRIPRRLWPTDKAVTEQAPYWDSDPVGSTSQMFPYLPKSIFKKTFEMAGMGSNDMVCYLPMISEEEVIGILAVWGPKLREEDIPGLSIFANQVTAAVKNSTLFHQAQEEIAIRKKAETRIQTALAEKEVLLKEIYHRVKNNLQVVSSLLNLQMTQTKDATAIETLRESQNRIRAMSLIHEKLYLSDDLAQVNFATYLHSLAASLSHTYRMDVNQVSLELQVDDIRLDLDTAIPCGLIVNELVSNALKYAFPAGVQGCVMVSCRRVGRDRYVLTVEDDGIGLPTDLNTSTANSLGLKLVTSLVKQIDGEIKIENTRGAKFTIQFSQVSHVDE